MGGRLLVILIVMALAGAALPAAAQGGTPPFDRPLEAALPPGETHTYAFDSPGNETLSASMRRADGPASALDPVLELLDPAGDLLAYSDDIAPGQPDAAFDDILLTAGGTYTLIARSFGNRSGGEYLLTARRTPLPALPPARSIALNSAVEGQIPAAGPADRWAFDGKAGQVVSIAVDQAPLSSLDPLVELIGPAGDMLAYSDDEGGGKNSLISGFTLPATGTYTIVARAWGGITGGAYMLTLSEGEGPPAAPPEGGASIRLPRESAPPIGSAGEIAPGQSVTGTLAGGTMDVWAFTIDEPLTVQVRMVALDRALDPFLELIGPDGTVLALDDDGGGGFDSLIGPVALAGPGTYTIRARSYADAGAGRYALALARVLPASP